MPEGIEVLLKGVPAQITPTIVFESLVFHKLQKRGKSAFLQGAGFHRVMDPVTGLGTDKIRGVVAPHPGDTYCWRHVVEDPLTDKKYLVHFPSLSCCFCQGQHVDKLHDEYAARVVRRILRDPALVLISTGSSAEEWLCVQECCDHAHGETFEQADTHISSFRHASAVGAAGVATRASKANHNLPEVKKVLGIRAEGTKCKRGDFIWQQQPYLWPVDALGPLADSSGRLVRMTVSWRGITAVVVAAYFPSNPTARGPFFRDVLQPFVAAIPSGSNLVLAGDLNVIEDPSLDKTSGIGSKGENDRHMAICSKFDVRDAFMAIHPYLREYTFFAAA
ncbi:unnamed protein product, partial [Closterium sp. NIES-53]